MAGTSSNFNADEFREGIREAMQMGLPVDPTARPVFMLEAGPPYYQKNGVTISEPALDRSGQPLDPEVSKIVPDPPEVTNVMCAVEVTDATATDLATAQLDPVGFFRPAKAVVTLLDQEAALVEGCTGMRYAGNTYTYGYTSMTAALFNAGVVEMTFFALDQE